MIPLDIQLAGHVLSWVANKVKSKVFYTTIENDYYIPSFDDDSQDTYYTGVVTEIKDDIAYLGSMYCFRISKVDKDVFVGSIVTGFVNKVKGVEGHVDGINVIDVLKDDEDHFSEIENSGTSRTGLISGKEGNIYYINPGPVQFDATQVKINFVPEVFDFVKLIIRSDVDADKGSLEEVVLEVHCVGYKTVAGRVTWLEDGSGLVDDVVSFEICHCQPGYVPSIDDQVVLSAIRCQRGSTKYRAVDVRPVADPDFKPLRVLFDEIILSPKEIVRVETGTLQEINAYLYNASNSSYVLTNILIDAGNNFVELIEPTEIPVSLKPQSKISCILQVNAKYIGFFNIQFKLTFETHLVETELRLLAETPPTIEVNVIENDNEVKPIHMRGKSKNHKYVLEPEPDNPIPGRRFKKPNNFLPVKLNSYQVPQVILDEFQNGFTNYESIERCIPCLQMGLKKDNYKNYMHALIYLEEVAVLLQLAKLEVVSAFDVQGDFLCLHIEEDSLFSSMLHAGDKVYASTPWNNDRQYEGTIWYVRPSCLMIKFRVEFHHSYVRGAEYRMRFHTGRTTFRLNHQALDDVLQRHGIHWLFPNDRIQPNQPPLVTLIKACIETTQLEDTLVGKQQKPIWNRHGAGYGRHQRMEEHKSMIPIGRLRQAKWFNSNLNMEQRTAVEEALKAKCRPMPYIIFGPPGTGKSFTLVELILQIYHTMPESKILVSGPSNSSVDVLALSIVSSGFIPESTVLRLCGYHYASSGAIPLSLIPISGISDYNSNPRDFKGRYDSSYECSCDMPSVDRDIIATKRVIFGTVTTLGGMRTMGFPRGFITHIVLDEAAQVKEPETLILTNMLSDSGVIVIAGDHMQLGPVVHSGYAARYGLKKSLFERFMGFKHYKKDLRNFPDTLGYNSLYIIKLVRSYRSLPAILHISNQLFYDQELICMVDTEKSREAQIYSSIRSIFPDESTIPVLFQSVKGQETTDVDSYSFYNLEEVFQVVSYIVRLYQKGVKPVDIGIITPYAAQVKQLRKFLFNMSLECPKIGSVEEFQGQERDVIILSTVRSTTIEVETTSLREGASSDNQTNLAKNIIQLLGFVSSPQRMNVSLTRARATLIVVGDSSTLVEDFTWRAFMSFCITNKSFIK